MSGVGAGQLGRRFGLIAAPVVLAQVDSLTSGHVSRTPYAARLPWLRASRETMQPAKRLHRGQSPHQGHEVLAAWAALAKHQAENHFQLSGWAAPKADLGSAP